MGLNDAFRTLLKAHVKGHTRVVNGKVIYIHDYDSSHPQGTMAQLHERTVIGKHRSGTHYLRATDAEDGQKIQEAADRLGIKTEKRRAGANHHGRVGAYDHFHVESPEHALALHNELKKYAPEVEGADTNTPKKATIAETKTAQRKEIDARNPAANYDTHRTRANEASDAAHTASLSAQTKEEHAKAIGLHAIAQEAHDAAAKATNHEGRKSMHQANYAEHGDMIASHNARFRSPGGPDATITARAASNLAAKYDPNTIAPEDYDKGIAAHDRASGAHVTAMDHGQHGSRSHHSTAADEHAQDMRKIEALKAKQAAGGSGAPPATPPKVAAGGEDEPKKSTSLMRDDIAGAHEERASLNAERATGHAKNSRHESDDHTRAHGMSIDAENESDKAIFAGTKEAHIAAAKAHEDASDSHDALGNHDATLAHDKARESHLKLARHFEAKGGGGDEEPKKQELPASLGTFEGHRATARAKENTAGSTFKAAPKQAYQASANAYHAHARALENPTRENFQAAHDAHEKARNLHHERWQAESAPSRQGYRKAHDREVGDHAHHRNQIAAHMERMGAAGQDLPDARVEHKGHVSTVEFGRNEGRAVLHPEHQEQVGALKDGESTHFEDEQRSHWDVQRKGDHLHFTERGASGLKGKVRHDQFVPFPKAADEPVTVRPAGEGKGHAIPPKPEGHPAVNGLAMDHTKNEHSHEAIKQALGFKGSYMAHTKDKTIAAHRATMAAEASGSEGDHYKANLAHAEAELAHHEAAKNFKGVDDESHTYHKAQAERHRDAMHEHRKHGPQAKPTTPPPVAGQRPNKTQDLGTRAASMSARSRYLSSGSRGFKHEREAQAASDASVKAHIATIQSGTGKAEDHAKAAQAHSDAYAAHTKAAENAATVGHEQDHDQLGAMHRAHAEAHAKLADAAKPKEDQDPHADAHHTKALSAAQATKGRDAKEMLGYSKAAHAASEHAEKTGKPEDHYIANSLHMAASMSHSQAWEDSGNKNDGHHAAYLAHVEAERHHAKKAGDAKVSPAELKAANERFSK